MKQMKTANAVRKPTYLGLRGPAVAAVRAPRLAAGYICEINPPLSWVLW